MTEASMTLSTDIHVITAEINSYKRTAVLAILEIGKRLKYVKENDLVHGEFTNFLRSVDIDPRTGRAMIQAYEQFGNRQTSTVLDLPVGKIFEMLSLPSDVDRGKFIETPHMIPSTGAVKTVDEMTVRELREVKAELQRVRKEAETERQARQDAEMEAAVLRETLESIEESPPEYIACESDGIYRMSISTEVSGTALFFSNEVRDFVKKYAHLAHHEAEFATMNTASSKEYASALDNLRSFIEGMYRAISFSKAQDGVIIDI